MHKILNHKQHWDIDMWCCIWEYVIFQVSCIQTLHAAGIFHHMDLLSLPGMPILDFVYFDQDAKLVGDLGTWVMKMRGIFN